MVGLNTTENVNSRNPESSQPINKTQTKPGQGSFLNKTGALGRSISKALSAFRKPNFIRAAKSPEHKTKLPLNNTPTPQNEGTNLAKEADMQGLPHSQTELNGRGSPDQLNEKAVPHLTRKSIPTSIAKKEEIKASTSDVRNTNTKPAEHKLTDSEVERRCKALHDELISLKNNFPVGEKLRTKLRKELLLDATRLGSGQRKNNITVDEVSEIADLKKYKELFQFTNTKSELLHELAKLRKTHPHLVNRTIKAYKKESEELNKKNISNTATDQSREPTKENHDIDAIMLEYIDRRNGIVSMISQLGIKLGDTITKLIKKIPEREVKVDGPVISKFDFNFNDLENDPKFDNDVQKLLEDHKHYELARNYFVVLRENWKTGFKALKSKIAKYDSKLVSDNKTFSEFYGSHEAKYNAEFWKNRENKK